MAGRGRGQSRAKLLESIGVSRAEVAEAERPTKTVGGVNISTGGMVPSPVYPPLQFKPLPLPPQTEREKYEFVLFKHIWETMSKSRFAIKEEKKQQDIERFSDRYRISYHEDQEPLNLHWADFPRELWPPDQQQKVKRAKNKGLHFKPRVPKKVKFVDTVQNKENHLDTSFDHTDMEKRLDDLENKEKNEDVEKDEDANEGDEENENTENRGDGDAVEQQEDDVEDDEELDKGNDYDMDYFDNGDDYGNEDDDGLEDGECYG